MLLTHNKKIKISLSDYPYKKDVANRLFLEDLTSCQIRILQELFYFGTSFPLADLAEATALPQEVVASVINTFSRTGLVLQRQELIFVDKELRKYFESQIQLFEEEFEPDLDYFQQLLKKVPISSLPLWYNIPKTSDNIFSSIVEKYLLTPKLYEKYLDELVFDEPLCRSILDELFSTPELCLPSHAVRKALNISKEKFQECMLILEFHLAAACRYIFDGTSWVQHISAFKEYRDFYLRDKVLHPCQISDDVQIMPANVSSEPFTHFRTQIEALQQSYTHSFGSVEKSVRELEKQARAIADDRWILVDDFIKWSSAAVGMQENVTLKRIGKRWLYTIPSYTAEQTDFIRHIITGLFFEMGITECGIHSKGPCFKITPFGRLTLGD